MRVFIRVPDSTFEACRRIAMASDKQPGTVARELIEDGLRSRRAPTVVRGTCNKSLNVSLPESLHETLVAAARREEERIGEPVDTATFARKMLHRGLESSHEMRKAS